MKKSIALFVVSMKNLKTLKSYIFEETLVLSIICYSKCEKEDKKRFKEE